MFYIAKLTPVEIEKLKQIKNDPVLWARTFIRISDPKTKK